MNVTSVYSRSSQRQYHGLVINEGEDLDLLASKLKSIIDDSETAESILENFDTIGLTGFSSDILREIANLTLPEEHYEEWRVGEALSQVLLEENYRCIVPFSKESNTTNHKTSNTGIDLLGLALGEDDSVLLLFAEVKTSSENRNPPQIVHGSSGCLTDQLKDIIKNKQKRMEHMRYLAKEFGSDHENIAQFVDAMNNYLDRGHYDLYGVVIRDTEPNERDLSQTANAIDSDNDCMHQNCTLLSLHVSSMTELKEKVLAA